MLYSRGMVALPSFAGSPILRSFLRALLFAVLIETIFYRLLTIPARSPAWPWIEDLHVSTGRAGELMFTIAFALLVPTILGLAYAALRTPAWPGSLNGLVGVGLLTLVALTVLAALSPAGPVFAIGFSSIAVLVSLGMLSGMYESREDLPGRLFAVTLAGSLACMAAATGSEWMRLLSGPGLPGSIDRPVKSAGMWLLFAAGVLAFPAFGTLAGAARGVMGRAATYGVSTATAFAFVVGAVAHPPLLANLQDTLGPGSPGSLAVILRTGAASAAVFLVVFTSLRGLLQTESRVRAYGLLFLLLSGYPHRIAYQHILGVLGLALVTGSSQAPVLERVSSPVDEIPRHGE